MVYVNIFVKIKSGNYVILCENMKSITIQIAKKSYL